MCMQLKSSSTSCGCCQHYRLGRSGRGSHLHSSYRSQSGRMLGSNMSYKTRVGHLQGSSSLLSSTGVHKAKCKFGSNISPIQAIFSYQNVLYFQCFTVGIRCLAVILLLYMTVAFSLQFNYCQKVFHGISLDLAESTFIAPVTGTRADALAIAAETAGGASSCRYILTEGFVIRILHILPHRTVFGITERSFGHACCSLKGLKDNVPLVLSQRFRALASSFP